MNLNKLKEDTSPTNNSNSNSNTFLHFKTLRESSNNNK